MAYNNVATGNNSGLNFTGTTQHKYIWHTPLFDLEFVDIRTKKPRRRSSLSKEKYTQSIRQTSRSPKRSSGSPYSPSRTQSESRRHRSQPHLSLKQQTQHHNWHQSQQNELQIISSSSRKSFSNGHELVRNMQNIDPSKGGEPPDEIRRPTSENARNAPGSSTNSAERRIARYKDERRRQLASQIANRLSSNKSVSSSSSTSTDEEDHCRVNGKPRRKRGSLESCSGGSGSLGKLSTETTQSGAGTRSISNKSGSSYSKYRRHQRSRRPNVDSPFTSALASGESAQLAQSSAGIFQENTPQNNSQSSTVPKRRRRKSFNCDQASPSNHSSKRVKSPLLKAQKVKKISAAQLGDADGEEDDYDDDFDIKDGDVHRRSFRASKERNSPEHIYHQIGSDALIRVTKKHQSSGQKKNQKPSPAIHGGREVKNSFPLDEFEENSEVSSRNDRLEQENIEILAKIKEIKNKIKDIKKPIRAESFNSDLHRPYKKTNEIPVSNHSPRSRFLSRTQSFDDKCSSYMNDVHKLDDNKVTVSSQRPSKSLRKSSLPRDPENKTHYVSTNHTLRNQITAQQSNAQPLSIASMPITSSLPPTSERNANIDLISPLPSDACNLKMTKSEGARSQSKDKSMKRKSVLNTYSSEELLLQAASSLQGLEDEFNSSFNSNRPRSYRSSTPSSCSNSISQTIATPQTPTQISHSADHNNSFGLTSSAIVGGTSSGASNVVTQPTVRITASILSSPDIIKSVSRNLTPPIPPASPKIVAETQLSSMSVPISDPLIDANWPGRPKRNNNSVTPPTFTSVDEDQKMFDSSNSTVAPPRRPRRQMSSPTFKKTANEPTESDRNGNVVKGNQSSLQLNISVAQSTNISKITNVDPEANNNTSANFNTSTHANTSLGKPPLPSSPPSSAPIQLKNTEKTPYFPNNDLEKIESSENMPAFMKEFVMRRKNSQRDIHNEFNPDEKAPPQFLSASKKLGDPSLPSRPHSAFIPRNPLPGSKKATSPATCKTETTNSNNAPSQSVEDSSKPLPPTRRRSDFVTKYEFLVSKAQKALQVVDKLETIVTKNQENTSEGIESSSSNEMDRKVFNDQGKGACLTDDDDEEIADVDFNEEEVLKRCRDFITDYDKNRQKRGVSNKDKTNCNASSCPNTNVPPIPKPRQSLNQNSSNRVAFDNNLVSEFSSMTLESEQESSIRARSSSLTLHDKRLQTSKAENIDIQCDCPNNKYYETSPDDARPGRPILFSMHSAPSSMPKPILKKSSEDLIWIAEQSTDTYKSHSNFTVSENKTLESILKNKESVPGAEANIGGNLKSNSTLEKVKLNPSNQATESILNISSILKQRNPLNESSENTGTSTRPEHVRIRSPSPDLDDFVPRPILRSRNNSVGGNTSNHGSEDLNIINRSSRASSPEVGGSSGYGVSFLPQSILKRRSSEAEDLDTARSFGDISGATSGHTSGATSRSSPEPPHGILKQRKWSVGSGSHSPDSLAISSSNAGTGVSISGAIISSILKKRSSSQHSSNVGSLEDLTSGGSSLHDGGLVKSILKKPGHSSSGHASNASGIGCSTDEELEENFEYIRSRPTTHSRKPRRSILKSRRSEESLSPLSDPNLYDSGTAGLENVPINGVAFSEGTSHEPKTEAIENGADSSSSSKSPGIRPILKQRDKSKSPTRGSTSTRSMSPLEGSSGFSSAAATTPGATSCSTPPIISGNLSHFGANSSFSSGATSLPSPLPRRSSLTFSPIKKSQQSSNENDDSLGSDNGKLNRSQGSPIRKTSFVSQKYIELSPARKLSGFNSLSSTTGMINSNPSSISEKIMKNETVTSDLVERVTFAAETISLNGSKDHLDNTNYLTSAKADAKDDSRIINDNQVVSSPPFNPVPPQSFGSILKRKGSKKENASIEGSERESAFTSLPPTSAPAEEGNSDNQSSLNFVPRPRKKSILRKDSSYEDNLRPILKNTGELESNLENAWHDNSSKAEARLLSPPPASMAQFAAVDSKDNLSPVVNSDDDDSSGEIKAGLFSDVIIDKPISRTGSLHNLDSVYIMDDEDNSDTKISPLEDENQEDEEIRQIFGNSAVLTNEVESENGNISSEELEEFGLVQTNSAFNDVIIDPIPGSSNVYNSSGSVLNSPIKTSTSSRKTSANLHSRQPVISPSSVKISADGNLADKLQHLTNTAESIKLRMMQSSKSASNRSTKESNSHSRTQNNIPPKIPSFIDLDSALPPSGASSNQNQQHTSQDPNTDCTLNPKSSASTVNKSSLSFKTSTNKGSEQKDISKTRKNGKDLPASEYYKIYQQTKKQHKQKPSFSDNEILQPSPTIKRRNDSDLSTDSEQCTKIEFINQTSLRTVSSSLGELNNIEKMEHTKFSLSSDKKIQGGGIAERMAALKKSGEEEWKKKIPRYNKNTIGEENKNVLNTIKTTQGENNKNNNSPAIVVNNNGNSNQSESSNDCENSDDVILRRNLHSNYNSPNNANKSRSVSLVDRLEKLQYSQNSWQSKVPEKDVRKFTVQGKMQQCHGSNIAESRKISKNLEVQKFEERKYTEDLTSRLSNQLSNLGHSIETDSSNKSSPIDSPLRRSSARSSFRIKKTPKPVNFKTSPPSNWVPSNENSSNGIDNEEETVETKEDNKKEQNELPKVETSTVEVELPLSNDKGLSNFFGKVKEEKVDILDCDFDLLLPAIAGDRHNAKLQHHKKDFAKNRKTQRRKPPSKNPLKALAERSDILLSYKETSVTTVTSDGRTLEIDTTKKHALAEKKAPNVHGHLAKEAMDALAVKVDFTKEVKLRKGNTNIPNAEFVPYKRKAVMLLQVKGRRPCQVRLVKASPQSVNSGDAYILLNNLSVHNSEIYVWLGKFVNAIEKSRASEVAQAIIQQKDLGCKATKIQTIEEEKSTLNSGPNRRFWQLLGCENTPLKVNEAGPAEEDDDYVNEINDLNFVWRVDPDKFELIPLEMGWGCVPRFEILSENDAQVLVFDFGSEMYIWNGKNAPFENRNVGLKVAKDLWENEQQNQELIVKINHPLFKTDVDHSFGPRPDWTLLGKVNQNGETILFREKFSDWPQDKDRKKKASELRQKFDSSVQKSIVSGSAKNEEDIKFSTDIDCDANDIANKILYEEEADPNLELEGTFVGRGRSYYDASERRQYEIDTLDLQVWHVSSDVDKEGVVLLDEKEVGEFYSEDTYVVRWKYKVSLTGRTLKGGQSKHVAVGRERWAYFFWQGKSSRINEKGASALMTVELDKEKGPQIRVDQGKEDAAFLNLFNSQMVIHEGSRNSRSTHSNEAALYIVRGETETEACLLQVPRNNSSLRSTGVFILINPRNKTFHVWVGKNCPDHKKEIAKRLANVSRLTKSGNFHTENEKQGEETTQWKNLMKSKEPLENMTICNLNHSQIDNKTESLSIRMYRMTSLSGDFHVSEVLCPSRNINVPNLLPFNQEDLYSAQQPALFFVDGGSSKILWLWQGWWPDVGHDANDTNTSTGSGFIRWHSERRAAMNTINEYRRLKYGRTSQTMKLVWAGHEPDEFISMFPYWKVNEHVKAINEKHIGNSNLEIVLDQLSKNNYTWDELQKRPLPDGVDPSRLEKYLSEEDFEKHLGISRESFNAAPHWKKLNIRKEKGLF